MENVVNTEKDQTNMGFIKMPKNIRQIGTIKDHNKVVYVEDYVMTYIKQLSARDYTGCKVAVLLGYYIRTEEGKNLFVKGAVEMKSVDISSNLAFSDEAWTSIYESIKKYFSDVEIVGWALIGPDFFLDNGEKLRKIHMDNFSGADKTLLKMDSMEKEEAFFFFNNNQLEKLGGYYIYYEKNEDMQNYMIENKEVVVEERNYVDHTTNKIRSIIKEKKEQKGSDINVIRILYAASATLTIVVLVIAAAMINNYGQLKNMETAINSLSNTLSVNNTKSADANSLEVSIEDVQKDAELPNEDETKDKADAKEMVETKDVDRTAAEATPEQQEETMAVETVSGNISAAKPVDKEKDETSKDSEEDAAVTKGPAATKDTTAEKEVADEKDSTKNDSKATSSKNEQKEEATIAEPKYYVIKSGDSLASISLKLYNSYNYMKEIKELNGIEDENKIFAGQKIIVP